MQRPASWKILGILQIVFGACGIALGLLNLLGPLFVDLMASFVEKMPGASQDKAMAQSFEMMRESLLYNAIHGAIYAVAGVWQLVAGIGLLRFRPGARLLNLAYAWFDIVFIIASAVIGGLVQARLHAKFPDQPGAEIGRSISIIGGAVMAVITLVWPVVLLVLLRRDPFRSDVAADDSRYGADDPANPFRSPGHGSG